MIGPRRLEARQANEGMTHCHPPPRRSFFVGGFGLGIEYPAQDLRIFASRRRLVVAAPDTDLLESVCENDRSVPHMLGGVTVTKLAPDILSKYAGTYEFAPGREAVITIEADLLFIREGSNPLKLPLVANSETVFVSRTNGDWIEFTRDARGVASGFVYHTGAGDRKAVRKQ